MSADALAGLLDMDGYALYVWGSFAMAAAAAAWEGMMLAHRRRRALEELNELRRLRAEGHGQDLADGPYTSAGHAP